MARTVALAGSAYLILFAVAAVLTGQRSLWLGDLSQLVPPLAFAALAVHLARQSAGQVAVFWNFNAIHAVIWAIGQAVWTYSDLAGGGVPIVAPSDPIFYMSSIPLAAALYGRPDRDRPRWLFNIVALDIVLIALFAAFIYMYFIVALEVTGGPEETYHANLTQLFNARNLLLAAWSAWIWHTAISPEWRRVLGIYCVSLVATFAFGVMYDFVEAAGLYHGGSLWDLSWMVPYVILAYAAARASDDRLLKPAEPAPAMAHLPVMSLIAIAMLALIPITAEIGRYAIDVSPAADAVRTRLALTMMIPFGVVVVIREFLSRRVLLRAGQELVQTREQLVHKEKLAAVGELVSGVAHELNNPLQGVLGYAELMAMTPTAAAQSEELRGIQANANRAAGIVRNLLTFAGRDAAPRSWYQVNAIIETAVAERASLFRLKGIHLHAALADRLPLIYLDAARFEQVILHLIDNAKRAIEARWTDRSDAAAGMRGDIRVVTRRDPNPDRIIVEVADGLGAPFVIELPVTTEPYFADEAHGGSTTQRPVAPREMPELPAPAVAAAKSKALVVDDEDSNAALVRRALEIAGYDVESTTLSRRALVMIERTPYDVVVADVKMPELSGQELYERACQIRPELASRFIFVTGDIDSTETLSFLEQTRCGYFMKPFNLDRLTTAVDMLVGGRRDEVPS